MRSLISLLLLVAVAAVVAPMFIRGPDGQPLLQPDQLLPAFIQPKAAPGTADSRNTSPSNEAVYRWQDDNGQWHYSDTPPAQGSAERVTLKPLNRIPATQSDSGTTGNTAPASGSDAFRDPAESQASVPATGTGLTAEEAAAWLQQVKETERKIKQRQAQIEALMENQ